MIQVGNEIFNRAAIAHMQFVPGKDTRPASLSILYINGHSKVVTGATAERLWSLACKNAIRMDDQGETVSKQS